MIQSEVVLLLRKLGGIDGSMLVAGARELVSDHLDAVHATVERRLFTCMKAALCTDEGSKVESL